MFRSSLSVLFIIIHHDSDLCNPSFSLWRFCLSLSVECILAGWQMVCPDSSLSTWRLESHPPGAFPMSRNLLGSSAFFFILRRIDVLPRRSEIFFPSSLDRSRDSAQLVFFSFFTLTAVSCVSFVNIATRRSFPSFKTCAIFPRRRRSWPPRWSSETLLPSKCGIVPRGPSRHFAQGCVSGGRPALVESRLSNHPHPCRLLDIKRSYLVKRPL